MLHSLPGEGYSLRCSSPDAHIIEPTHEYREANADFGAALYEGLAIGSGFDIPEE